MKKIVSFTVLIILTSALWAQDCSLYIPFEEGKGFQYQNFNRRDRLEGTNDMVIKSVTRQGNQTEALMQVKYYDSRNREQHEGEYLVICKGDELIIDFQSMLGPQVLPSGEGMEVSMSNVNHLSIPSAIKVGDKLPDATMDMKVSMGTMSMSDMKFTTRNRKVESKESITTPAGTFECFKITYEHVMDSRLMGINRQTVTKGVEYFAPGVGNIRSEHYDDKDRLQSYTVLSKIY